MFKANRVAYHTDRANIGPVMQRRTLNTFAEFIGGETGARAIALAAARKFVAERGMWESGGKLRYGLYFYGDSGTGKSGLAAATLNAWLGEARGGMYQQTSDLLDHLRATFGPSSEVSYDELFTAVKEAPLLVLDDIGTESATQWAIEKLYQIVDYRYREGLPIIVTSNLAPGALTLKLNKADNLTGVRIISRLNEMCMTLKFEGQDQRK